MNLLAIQLPPRPRVEGAASAPTAWAWVGSADGQGVDDHGTAAAALLPRADRVVAVLDAADVAWHRINLPKVPQGRLRAALDGLLEDQWLEDPAQLHVALEPGSSPGQPCWVAVTHRAWLQTLLAALAAHGIEPERIVPAWSPSDVRWGHFELTTGLSSTTLQGSPAVDDPLPGLAAAERPHGFGSPGGEEASGRLTLSGPEGVTVWPLGGGAVRGVLEEAERQGSRWSAVPAAVTLAERWLDRTVEVLGPAEVTLRASLGGWDLRQFDLALPRRGTRRLELAWRTVWTPAWRPARIGVATLLAVQLLGLNAWAWHQEQRIAELRAAQVALLRATHPTVRAVLDAPRQMQRETDRLRSQAGQPGEADLEAALAAAALAWPREQAPARALQFDNGILTLSVDGWTGAQAAAFGEALRASGWQAALNADRLTLRRQAPGANATSRVGGPR